VLLDFVLKSIAARIAAITAVADSKISVLIERVSATNRQMKLRGLGVPE
jgi:hypothetical protein